MEKFKEFPDVKTQEMLTKSKTLFLKGVNQQVPWQSQSRENIDLKDQS